MKKCLSMILAVLLLCGGIITGSLAEGEFEYTAKGKKAEITAINGEGEVEVPAELDGNKVTSIGMYVFNWNNTVTKVTLPEGLQKIERGAFAGNNKLTEINIPDSVTSIGNGAFSSCSALETVEISPYHKTYGICNKQLFLKKNMTLLRYYGTERGTCEVFWGIKTIGEEAFSGSTVSTIILPDSVTAIGPCAFISCGNLKNIFIPNSVKSIGVQAFCFCDSLESISIPASVTRIDPGIFDYCGKLTDIQIDPANKKYEAQGLFLIDKTKKMIISAPSSLKGKVEIPDGIKEIGNGAFQGCSDLKELTIPDSVKKIGVSAFWNCSRLVVKAHAGSAAQKYCEQNDVQFEVIE